MGHPHQDCWLLEKSRGGPPRGLGDLEETLPSLSALEFWKKNAQAALERGTQRVNCLPGPPVQSGLIHQGTVSLTQLKVRLSEVAPAFRIMNLWGPIACIGMTCSPEISPSKM